MLFQRQQRLLAFLDAFGGSLGHLDFQKQLFRICQLPMGAGWYDFVPYKFGAFSFTSYADKRKLVEGGYVEDDDQRWTLTALARKVVKPSPDLQWFARTNQHLHSDDLVAVAYREHPYYATRSTIAERILANDPAALSAIRKAAPARGKPGLVTIGYEGLTLESYLNRLLHDGVTLLCDVRRNPLSRKYGFSKGTLSTGCAGVGLRYEHLPELGIASDERRTLEVQADYDELFERYRAQTLPKQGDALDQIATWVREGHRVALTCFEHLPHQCHRHCVANAVHAKHGQEYKPNHL